MQIVLTDIKLTEKCEGAVGFEVLTTNCNSVAHTI